MNCTRCNHPRSRHEHYRPGSDCGGCDCLGYTRLPFRWLRWLLNDPKPRAVR